MARRTTEELLAKIEARISREKTQMFYAGYDAGKFAALPGKDETLAFLYHHATPEGRISTPLESFADNLLEWLETWSDD